MATIQNLTAPITPPVLTPAAPASRGGAAGFTSALSDAIGRVDQGQKVSQESIDRLLSGESDEVHEVALVTQRAELQFELFLQVRNKMVQAYQEVMRMQL